MITISTGSDTGTCGDTNLLGPRTSSTQGEATAEPGFFTRKDEKSVLLTSLVFSLHS